MLAHATRDRTSWPSLKGIPGDTIAFMGSPLPVGKSLGFTGNSGTACLAGVRTMTNPWVKWSVGMLAVYLIAILGMMYFMFGKH